MQIRNLKLITLSSFLFLTGFATASALAAGVSAEGCTKAVQAAKLNHRVLEDRFQVGEVSRTPVTLADLQLKYFRFRCTEISKEQYCETAIEQSEKLQRFAREELAVNLIEQYEYEVYAGYAAYYAGVCR